MATEWAIVGQRQTQRLDPTRRVEDVMEVSFVTDSGTIGTVTVPIAAYTPEIVADIVGERVRQIKAVESL